VGIAIQAKIEGQIEGKNVNSHSQMQSRDA
jgi:hypothetical protein